MTPATRQSGGTSLRVASLQLLSGNGTYALCQWLTITVLALLGGPVIVGMYTLGTALSMPLVAFSQLALRQVLINDAQSEFAFATYIRLRLISAGLAFFALSTVAFALGFEGAPFHVIVGIGLARCLESIADIYYGELQKRERVDLVGRLMSLAAVTNFVAVGSIFALSRSIEFAAIAFAVACVCTLAIVTRTTTRVIPDEGRVATLITEFDALRRLFLKTWPIGFAHLFVSVNSNTPRYVIEHVGGVAALGQYAVIEQFLTVGSLVVNSIGQAAAPRLANHFSMERRHDFFAVLRNLIAAALVLGAGGLIGALLAGDTLVSLLYGPNFGSAAEAFAPLMASSIFVYLASFLGYAFTATAQYGSLVWRSVITACVTASATLFVLPALSLPGVAFGIAAGSITSALLSWFGVRSAFLKQQANAR